MYVCVCVGVCVFVCLGVYIHLIHVYVIICWLLYIWYSVRRYNVLLKGVSHQLEHNY